MASGNGNGKPVAVGRIEFELVKSRHEDTGKQVGAIETRLTRIEDILISMAQSGFIERLQAVEHRLVELEPVPMQIRAIASDILTIGENVKALLEKL